MQPDFGSAMIIFLLWFTLLIIVGTRKSFIFLMVISLILSFTFAWFFMFKDYQKHRILTFVNPANDPLGRGYNLTQSKIAAGSGKLFGKGLGFGSQTQLKFLPESQTDFIFAVICEELGFVGAIIVLSLLFVVLYRILRIAYEAKDDFSLVICLGIFIIIFLHSIINIGMNIGLAPVMGISLPFVSYGGSFLVVCLFMIGLVQSVYIKTKQSFE